MVIPARVRCLPVALETNPSRRTVKGAEPLSKDEIRHLRGLLTVDMTQSSILQVGLKRQGSSFRARTSEILLGTLFGKVFA